MTTMNPDQRNDMQPERLNDRPTVAPRVDIYENADEILLMVDLPGVPRDALGIDLDKGQLTLHAERTVNNTGTSVNVEFGTRAYHRVFTIPRGIDVERIVAELKRGVLTLHLPKSAAVKPRRIEVSAN